VRKLRLYTFYLKSKYIKIIIICYIFTKTKEKLEDLHLNVLILVVATLVVGAVLPRRILLMVDLVLLLLLQKAVRYRPVQAGVGGVGLLLQVRVGLAPFAHPVVGQRVAVVDGGFATRLARHCGRVMDHRVVGIEHDVGRWALQEEWWRSAGHGHHVFGEGVAGREHWYHW
jgi:hypothetical protein